MDDVLWDRELYVEFDREDVGRDVKIMVSCRLRIGTVRSGRGGSWDEDMDVDASEHNNVSETVDGVPVYKTIEFAILFSSLQDSEEDMI